MEAANATAFHNVICVEAHAIYLHPTRNCPLQYPVLGFPLNALLFT